MRNKDFAIIKDYASNFKGATLSSNGKVIYFKTGYMVSLNEYGCVYSSIEELDKKTFKKYMRIAKSKKAYIGIWLDEKDNDKCYLDISLKINEHAEAMSVARREQQLAIYDIANGQCLRVI